MDALAMVTPWYAALAVLLALVLVGVAGMRTWRSWRRAVVTRDAAEALLAAHLRQLDAAAERHADVTATLDEQRARLAGAVAELQADLAHLRWLLAQVPESRSALRAAAYASVLPGWLRARREEQASSDA